MIKKNAAQVGSSVIRARSQTVSLPISTANKKIIADLIDSMRHHELVGMAAPQLGKSVRIFVTEIRKTRLRKGDSVKNSDPLRIFLNPKIISVSKKTTMGWEGCGSVATSNLFGMVKRPATVTVEAVNENGKLFQLMAHDLLARVIQHEMDHLNGIVFTDKADSKTYMSRGEYLKLRSKT